MTRTDDVRRLIKAWPCSVQALARASGVPQSTLSRIKNGHLGASPEVAEAVREVCERYSAVLAEAARTLKGGDNE
jgi:DNA-binding LacI/PurR family transcriptional regulator